MNKVMINGRLIREPEIQELENNNFKCTIFIANDVFFGTNKETGFYRVVAWGKLGRIVAENSKTGTELFITGRLEQHTYQDENGKTVFDVGIVMEQFDFGARATG
mgnify:CR=1 FL=1